MKLSAWMIAAVIFACTSAGADFAVTHWAIYDNASSDAGRLYHLINENGDEIPIFGASKVYYDYIPTEMGVNAFNYGLDGSSFEVVDTFLEIELAKHKTSPIIIDLKPQSERGIGDPSAYVPFVFNSRIRGLLERTHAMKWQYFVPGLRYFGYFDYYLKQYINDRAQLMRKVERGFSYEKYWTFDRGRLDEAVRQRTLGPNGYFPDEDQNARLIEHITRHPERLFFLIYSPVHSSNFANFRNVEQFEAFKAKLRSLPNAVLMDYQLQNYPDEWFKDTTHLLYDGALAFSRTLGGAIKAELKARAGDAGAAQRNSR